MTERLSIAVSCLGAAAFLASILILAWAIEDERELPPMRLEDRST
ncbi:hypothetical protein [Methylocystis heyeri]|nr:hypothetical protein [Methylocystis heyeri]